MTHRQIDRHLRGERPRDYRLHQCLGNNALGTAFTADFDVEAKRLRRAAEAGLCHLIKSKRCRSHTTSRMGTRLPRVRARRSRRLGDQALAGEIRPEPLALVNMVVPPAIAAPCTAAISGLSKSINAFMRRAWGDSPGPGGFFRKSSTSLVAFD
jgi:hypothetical protein